MSSPTPPERTTQVPFDNRTRPVPVNDRAIVVPDDE